jgi:hypothetical protein
MYIKSISLENYRCHKKTEIDFFPGGTQGYISIIEGGDGDGKTTLFNAIGWCLYGKETSELLGEPKQSLGIPNVSSINNDGLSKLSVDLWLEIGESAEPNQRPISMRAVRKASIRGINIVDQEFSLQISFHDENPKVLRDQEAERYIENIAPSDLIEFYMFNGEYLSSGKNVKGENIDASIKRLGYHDLLKWANAHGLEHNITKSDIGSQTVDALLYESESALPNKKPGRTKS